VDIKSMHSDLKRICLDVPCEYTWTHYAQKKVSKRLRSETGHTEDSCQQACVDTVGCTGVDYYKQPSGECWFIGLKDQAVVDDLDCVHYDFDLLCPAIEFYQPQRSRRS